MMRFVAFGVPCLATALLTACAPAAPRTGTAELSLQPAVKEGAFRTQEVKSPYTAAHINQLQIKLFKLAGGSETAALDGAGQPIAKDIPNSSLGGRAVFTNLDFDTTYRVRAYAYLTAGTSTVISTNDSRSYLDVAVGRDDRPVFAALPVQLIDQTFSGEATSSGTAVTDGGLVPPASESLALGEIPESEVTTLAGLANTAGTADGTGSTARFNDPRSISFDASGNLYVVDYLNNRIRVMAPGGAVTTLAGGTGGYLDGAGGAARFSQPQGVVLAPGGGIFVADYVNCAIRLVTPAGQVTTVTGSAPPTVSCADLDGTGLAARLNRPFAITADGAGNLFITEDAGARLRKLTPAGDLTTPATDLNAPFGVAVAPDGTIYVSDYTNHVIKKIAGSVTVLAGSSGSAGSADGLGSATRFNSPWALAVDQQGNVLVTDVVNCTIRKVTPAGYVTTLAGLSGTCASTDGTGGVGGTGRFKNPLGIAVGPDGHVYVGDGAGHTIRRLSRTSLPVLGPITDKYPSGAAVPQLAAVSSGGQSAAAGNYVYVMGGYNGGADTTTVQRAAVNADGTLGAFSVQGVTLTHAITNGTALVSGNKLYVIGGRSVAFTPTQKIDVAALNADGSLNGTFTAVAANLELSAARAGPAVVQTGSFVHALGGNDTNSLVTSTIQRAPVAQDGTLGSWTVVGNLAEAVYYAASVKVGNNVYLLGGFNGAATNKVQRATVNADGTLGAFAVVPGVTLATAEYFGKAVVIGKYVYVLGGTTGGAYISTIQQARINADGSIGTFATYPRTMAGANGAFCLVQTGGFLYFLGGENPGFLNIGWSAPIAAP
jgi:streptogramin lyase